MVSLLLICLCDPGHRWLIATTRKDPGASAGVPVGAKGPLEKGWRPFLPTLDHEGIPLEFIHVVEGITHGVLSWFFLLFLLGLQVGVQAMKPLIP